MERYQTYMDGITMPDTLQEKLRHLEKPPVQKQPWQRYCALAAAIVLVAGISVLGMRGILPRSPHEDTIPPVASATPTQPQSGTTPVLEATSAPAASEGQPERPLPAPDPQTDLDHGYTIYKDGTALFYDLPDLLFASASASADGASNYVLNAPNGTQRVLDRADVVCLAGGEEGLQDHLLWSGLSFDGELFFNENGTFHALSFSGISADWRVSLEMLEGREVPDCVVGTPDSITEWQGITIAGQDSAGYSEDGIAYCGKRVSFQCGGYGYKFTAYALSPQSAGSICARFVRFIVFGGFHPECLAVSGSADNLVPEPSDLGGVLLPTAMPDIPDRGAAPSDMPTANTIHPGEEGYGDPEAGPDGVENANPPAEPSPTLPDKGVPPSDMPTAHIIHPGEEGYVDPLPPPPESDEQG